jgi:nucleoid DNA-binding protein
MIIGKKDIVDNIYRRINGVVPKSYISDIVTVICDHVIEKLAEQLAFSVSNFGTFSVSVFHGHHGYNIASGDMQYVKSFKTIKFYPHDIFYNLAQQKKKRFVKVRKH